MLKFKLNSKFPGNRVVLVIAVCMVSFSVNGIAKRHSSTTKSPSMLDASVVTQSIDVPEESPIYKNTPYNVPADMPKLIDLPTIQTSGYIQSVGLTKDNTIASPSNIHLAGWYIKSAKPGQAGLSIIDGHVQGIYTDGLFKALNKLLKNDSFYVEYGDGTRHYFQVISVAEYSIEEAGQRMQEKLAGVTKQLNLITCSGQYDKTLKQFQKRLLVVAKLTE